MVKYTIKQSVLQKLKDTKSLDYILTLYNNNIASMLKNPTLLIYRISCSVWKELDL